MNKVEFLKELENRLKKLPKDDREERLNFYDEMIEDRILEGKSEEEAINEIGPVDKIIDDIVNETPLLSFIKEQVKPKRPLRGWEIIIMILGFPLWFPLLLTFFILVLVAYLIIWLGVVVVYVIEIADIVATFMSFVILFIGAFNGEFSLLALGSGILGFGLACLLFLACIGVTKGTYILSKKIMRGIKYSFIKKGEK